MSLFAQWKDQLENQTEETFDEFWDKYSSGETGIYSEILGEKNPLISGTIGDLSSKYRVEPVIFMGFLDGINTSLKTALDLESLSEEDDITLNIDFEKLYFKMLKAQADYLFLLNQWDDVLTKERRNEIAKEYKKSKTLVKDKTPGRNDPCPCGSGKKYKKCCGA
jgi:hypothetical protein